MGVTKIKTSQQYKDATTKSGLTAIQFVAPWEEPCKTMSPKFAGYSDQDKYKHVEFYNVDIGESEDVAMDSGVKFTPAYHFYKDGKQVSTYVGSSYPALERALAAVV